MMLLRIIQIFIKVRLQFQYSWLLPARVTLPALYARHPNTIRLFLFGGLAVGSLPAIGQPSLLRFEHLTTEQGLSQASVWKVHQDKLGFMWMVTHEGLNLYDGYHFTVFKNLPDDSLSLSNNITKCIAEDKEGNIWVGTSSGLNRYDRKTNRFERFSADVKNKKSLSNNIITALYYDSKNNLWVGTESGLNRYDPTTKTFHQYIPLSSQANAIPDGAIEVIIEDASHRLWIGSMGGLSRLNPDGQSFTNYYHSPTDPNTLGSSKVTALYPEGEHTLWIGTFDAGLDRMNTQDGTVTHFPHNPDDPTSLASPYVFHINQNKAGQLYISTDNGLNVINKEKGTFMRYVHSDEDKNSLSWNMATYVFFDLNERMWLSTRFSGVNVYDPGKYKFLSPGSNNQLKGRNVTSFSEDENKNVWIGTDGNGIYHLDRSTGVYSHFTHQAGNPNSLSNDKVLAVKLDHLGNLWIGYWSGGVDVYDRKNKTFKHFTSQPANPKSLIHNNIFYIFEDKKGNIWIATCGNGVSKYNRNTNNFTQYTHDPKNPNSIAQSIINHITEDHLGNLWFATQDKGLQMFDPTTETFVHYKAGGQKGDLSGNLLLSVFEDSKHRLWVGTKGAGLNLFDRKSGTFKVYRQQHGLSNETIIGILEDKNHHLWLSTNKGICKFNPDQLIFTGFDGNDGLNNTQFSNWAFTHLSSHELLFGGPNGFDLFDPDRITDNKYLPPVYITDFKLFNKPVQIGENEILQQNILLTDTIVLNYAQNFFAFEFTALNYRQPEANRYKYIMEGLHKEWIDVGNEKKVSFTNMDPGHYVLRVKASNNDGLWNEKGTSLTIIITPPFWQTWWFRTLVLVTIVGSAVTFYRVRMNAIKAQKVELERQVMARTQDLLQANQELNEQKEEIMQQQEEMQAQADLMQVTNQELVETQQELLQQQHEIQAQRDNLQQINENVMSSIQYANTIQKAILPSNRKIAEAFQEHFTLYRPKDVVSGDFYWFAQVTTEKLGLSKPNFSNIESDLSFIAVVDCTGHGVPGAFMSIIGSTLLNEIVNQKHILDPALILEELNLGVKQAVEKSEGVNTAGMDVCLCRIEKRIDGQIRLLYAGAKRSLLFVRKQTGVLEMLEADRKSIGTDSEIPFTTKELFLAAGDMLYLTSDGYADQNNPQREKLGSAKVRQVIQQVAQLEASAQKSIFETTLDEYQQQAEQRDDITLIGVRV